MKNEKVIVWDVTSQCNLACKHCFNWDRYNEKKTLYGFKEEMNTQECISALQKIKSGGINHIHLLGGEPLLKRDIIKIISIAKSMGMMVTINTNGTLLNKQISQKLLKLNVENITISIDGATEEMNDEIRGKGVFKRLIYNISQLVNLKKIYSSKTIIGLAFTMNRKNLQDMCKFVELARFLEVDSIIFADFYLSGRAMKNPEEWIYSRENCIDVLEKLCEKIKKENLYKNFLIQMDLPYSLVEYLKWRYNINFYFHPKNMMCNAGEKIWYMQADGRILPCGMTNNPYYSLDLIQKGEFIIEDINIRYITSLKEVESSELFISFLKFKEKVKKQDRESCKICKYRGRCYPCPILHFNKNDVPDCTIVFKRKNEYLEKILKSKVYIRNEFLKLINNSMKHKDIKLEIIFKNNEKNVIELKGDWFPIVKEISAQKEARIVDIINSIGFKFGIKPKDMQEEVVKFLKDLEDIGIAYIF